MGTYLSTPVTEKQEEQGESEALLWMRIQSDSSSTNNNDNNTANDMEDELPVRWAVVDMQGWRKSMEDAHIVETRIPKRYQESFLTMKRQQEQQQQQQHQQQQEKLVSLLCNNFKLFGVFDGHGGPEVARFCQLYMTSVLLQYNHLWSPMLLHLPQSLHPQEEQTDPTSNDNIIKKEMGQALIETFHGLDRMIDDQARRDELVRLRSMKPPPEERRDAGMVPPFNGIGLAANSLTNNTTGGGESSSVFSLSKQQQQAFQASMLAPPPPPPPVPPTKSTNEAEPPEETKTQEPQPSQQQPAIEKQNTTDPGETDYDSDEQVGKEEACAEREKEDDSDDVVINPYPTTTTNEQTTSDDENDVVVANNTDNSASGKVSFMFQRLLNMSGTGTSPVDNETGQIVITVGDASSVGTASTASTSSDDNNTNNNDNPAKEENNNNQNPPGTFGGQNGIPMIRPTLVQNGRLICNLPDHPIHAGCTSVVAMIIGTTLTVANAGDSRAVLCRKDGLVYPLSYDHKPQQLREMNRIKNSGGFVNQFGRVNGNLNLSRSIGDLKYKQVPGILPKEQMITAEPDIIQVTLVPNEDEFIILGCDGIWDCLTNERAVQYVREKIDTMQPKQIGIQMLDEIISDDPKATQGIGGDNMTIMIIDLKPTTRNYHKAAEDSGLQQQQQEPQDDVVATPKITTIDANHENSNSQKKSELPSVPF